MGRWEGGCGVWSAGAVPCGGGQWGGRVRVVAWRCTWPTSPPRGLYPHTPTAETKGWGARSGRRAVPNASGKKKKVSAYLRRAPAVEQRQSVIEPASFGHQLPSVKRQPPSVHRIRPTETRRPSSVKQGSISFPQNGGVAAQSAHSAQQQVSFPVTTHHRGELRPQGENSRCRQQRGIFSVKHGLF